MSSRAFNLLKPPASAPKVLFVCTGNICRSPTAHALLLHHAAQAGWAVEVDSAAVSDEERGNPVDPRSTAELLRRGIPALTHRARQVQREDFSHFDWVIGMTQAHCRALERQAPPDGGARVALFLDGVPGRQGQDVPDPWYGDQRDFVKVFDLIDVGVKAWMARWSSLA